MALSEEVKAKLSKHLEEETARHAEVGVKFPLAVVDFETDLFDADIVAMAFISQGEKRGKGEKKKK